MTLLEILNLIITGLPSILIGKMYSWCCDCRVLNLIITGMPSIQLLNTATGFKFKF